MILLTQFVKVGGGSCVKTASVFPCHICIKLIRIASWFLVSMNIILETIPPNILSMETDVIDCSMEADC